MDIADPDGSSNHLPDVPQKHLCASLKASPDSSTCDCTMKTKSLEVKTNEPIRAAGHESKAEWTGRASPQGSIPFCLEEQ